MALKSVISVISKRSNTGKTTLITNVLPLLKKKGLKVMTVKYSCYDFNADQEGTDSHKHFSAGADRTVIVGPTKFVAFERTNERLQFEEIIAAYDDVDLIIAEGFRNVPYPTIEVVRSEMGDKIITNPSHLIAVATDIIGKNFGVKSISLSDYDALADIINSQYLTQYATNLPLKSKIN